MNTYAARVKHSIDSYWQRWREDPLKSFLQLTRWVGCGMAVAAASITAMYFHGIPYVQYDWEVVAGNQTQWPSATEKSSASYFSFPGTLEAVAHEYSEGCDFVIWVPVDHIEGLDEKLPFSILRKAEDWFRSGPPTNTRQRL